MYGIDPGCVDSDMLRVIECAGDNPAKRLAVIEESAGNPRSLIGYQVRHAPC
jgi:rRNA maturation protein Rpf1